MDDFYSTNSNFVKDLFFWFDFHWNIKRYFSSIKIKMIEIDSLNVSSIEVLSSNSVTFWTLGIFIVVFFFQFAAKLR